MMHYVTHSLALTDATAGELRAHLARLDMTIGTAAERIGVSASWLQRRLNGRISPTLADLERICTGLGISTSDVIR